MSQRMLSCADDDWTIDGHPVLVSKGNVMNILNLVGAFMLDVLHEGVKTVIEVDDGELVSGFDQ